MVAPATIPIIYYFPLLWKATYVCQDDLVVDQIESTINAITLPNLKDSYGSRRLCEQDCPVANFNGFLNWAMDASCKDPTALRFHCDCKASSTSCIGDSLRLTHGTNGFLEVFGVSGDQPGWYPVCSSTSTTDQSTAQLAQVVCRTLQINFDPQYGLTLPIASPYNSSSVYFPYDVACTGTEATLKACSITPSSTTCPITSSALFIRCMSTNATDNTTQRGTEPKTILHVVPAPGSTTTSRFELFEPTVGRWTPISELGWTPLENDRACRQSGKLDLFGASRMFSCLQYFEYYKSRDVQARSGLYNVLLSGTVYPVWCDMDWEQPGWTLLFNNTFDTFWTRAKAEAWNDLNYTAGVSYSILGQADRLMERFPGRMYDVRVEAYGEGVQAAGVVFRLLKTQSLLTETISPITAAMVLHKGPQFKEDPQSGFTLHVPHFSHWVDGNSIYGMNNHTRPASLYGNLIARNPSPMRRKYSYWVPGIPDLPPYVAMWVREVSNDKTLVPCSGEKALFELREFNRRQIFASRSVAGHEPWVSHLAGAGWVTASPTAGTGNAHRSHDWIMVDLLRVYRVTQIAVAGVTVTAGTTVQQFWVKKFNVELRSRWSETFHKVGTTAFTGNTDATTVVLVKFRTPENARFIRLIPIEVNGQIGLRWTVYGCPRGPLYPTQYLLSHHEKYNYLVGSSNSTQPEASYFNRTTDCDLVKLELNLKRATLITGLILAGNPYVGGTVKNVKAYCSAEGSRGNLKLMNGTLRGVPDTAFSMSQPDEPVYVTVDRFGARMLRLLVGTVDSLDKPCPFRFEIVGLVIPDWCNLPLGINDVDYVLNVSSVRGNSNFYGTGQLKMNSTLTQAGFGAWVPASRTTDPAPWITIDVKGLHTITGLAIDSRSLGERWGLRTDWTSVNISYGLVAGNWTLYGDIAQSLETGRNEGADGVTVTLNPPIGQARFIRLDLEGVRVSLQLELFGCKIPPSNSDTLPGWNVLRGTNLSLVASGPPAVQLSLRATFETNQAGTSGFVYYPSLGMSTVVPLPNSTSVNGFIRDSKTDLYWPDTHTKPDWGVRPIVSSFNCNGPPSDLSQCSWSHAHDDPSNPSSPILPDCATYCGDPGRISQTRKQGLGFAYLNPPVTYTCLYDFSNLTTFSLMSLNLTCLANGQWDSEVVRCPMFSTRPPVGAQNFVDQFALAENRPWVLSSVDVDLSWMAKSWTNPAVTVYDNTLLKCQATKQETYPYVMLDLIGPVEVQAVTVNFGISQDLMYSKIDILVTNNRNPRLAANDICYTQDVNVQQHTRGPTFICERELIGRYVYVTFREHDPMNLYICDISIQGATPSPYNNLAEFQKTSQSSILLAPVPVPTSDSLIAAATAYFFSHLAVDGNTATAFDPTGFATINSSCSATTPETAVGWVWWSVDLGQESAVYKFTVYFNASLYGAQDLLEVRVSNVNPMTLNSTQMNDRTGYTVCATGIVLSTLVSPLRQACIPPVYIAPVVPTPPVPVTTAAPPASARAGPDSDDGLVAQFLRRISRQVAPNPSAVTPVSVPGPIKPAVYFGRYVTFVLTNPSQAPLVLCEVRVWGRNCTEHLDRALFKPVRHSELADSTSGSYLVDGNRDTQLVSNYQLSPWFLVDLIGTYTLDYVEVALGQQALTDFNISTGLNDTVFFPIQTGITTAPNQVLRVPLNDSSKVARYVRVTTTSLTSVSMEIRDLKAVSRACVNSRESLQTNYRNLVLASSTLLASAPEGVSPPVQVTVDGIKAARETMCFVSSVNVFWQVSMRANATVYRVSVYGSFSGGLSVMVDQVLCGRIQAQEHGIKEKSIVCGREGEDGAPPAPAVGSVIRVQQDEMAQRRVTLCEVEVWGTCTNCTQ